MTCSDKIHNQLTGHNCLGSSYDEDYSDGIILILKQRVSDIAEQFPLYELYRKNLLDVKLGQRGVQKVSSFNYKIVL